MANTTLGQFQFLAGAPSYSIGVLSPNTLELDGGGVTENLSGNNQVIVVLAGGTLLFANNSTAGDSTIGYSNRGGAIVFNDSTAGSAEFENQSGGTITFINGNAGNSVIANNFGAATVTFEGLSTAGNASITNTTATGGGSIVFADTSTAGSAVIQNLTAGDNITFQDASNAGNASITNVSGSTTTFTDSANAAQSQILNAGLLNFTTNSTAGTSIITNNGTTTFTDSATAGQANITNNATLNFMGTSTGGTATITTNSGGTTSFFDSSSGGMARFITNAGGVFDMSPLSSGGMTAGSIEGAGNYFLGSKELTTGSNNLSTTVSGVIADGGAAGGSGGSLTKVGTGTLTLTNANTYTGPTIISQGAINLTGSLLSPVSVEPNGILGSTGTVFNTVTNAGTVEPGLGLPLGQFGALTVNDYVGVNGTLALNTYLGADDSPSDQLVVNGGTATGSTSILINNVGGPGLETTANGILVVNAINGATTASGAFTLDNPELRAGDYDYRLYQGGLNGTDPNDWFLRSTFISPDGPGPVEPGPPLPPTPPPDPLPPGVFPIIGPELATYGVVQPTARELGLDTLGTLHERIGDTLTWANAGSGYCTAESCSEWGRFFGQQVDNHYQAFADPRDSGWMGGFQGGVDLWRGSLLPGHRDATGIYVAYGNANMNVNGLVTNAAATGYVVTHTGSVNLEAFSGGAYWTHYGPSGWYLDAVLQGTFYTGSAGTQFANLPINGGGFVSSLEAGYPVPLPLGPRFVLEPQAQIIWQQVAFGDANDGLGEVALGTTSGPTGRLGVRGMWTIDGENGQVWQPYVRANLWRDWDAQVVTMFGSDAAPLEEKATRLEFAAGVTSKLNDRLSLYGQGGYQFAVSQTDDRVERNAVKGDIGLRYTW
jgi:outer membrane autotransporter protein